jgi:hypothetical protein
MNPTEYLKTLGFVEESTGGGCEAMYLERNGVEIYCADDLELPEDWNSPYLGFQVSVDGESCLDHEMHSPKTIDSVLRILPFYWCMLWLQQVRHNYAAEQELYRLIREAAR